MAYLRLAVRRAAASFPLLRRPNHMETTSTEPSVQGVPDPPALPPKSPLRGLRTAASLHALAVAASSTPIAVAASSSTPGAGPSSVPHQARRPPPIIVPPVPPFPVPKDDSFNALNSPPTTSNSTSSWSRSRSTGRHPSFASSHISGNSGASQSTLDTVSRLVLADSPPAMAVASPISVTSLTSTTTSTIPSSASASLYPTVLSAHTTKRTHALTELLTSERVYASDLAIMRHVHIPLALSQPPQFHPPPSNDPSSSQSNISLSDPPMTLDDVRVIFSNVEEMAIFADAFAERIEAHMGDVLLSILDRAASPSSSNGRKDSIGELFLEVVSIVSPHATPWVFALTSCFLLFPGEIIFTKRAFTAGPRDETTLHCLHNSTPACALPPRRTHRTCSGVLFHFLPPAANPVEI